MKRWLAPVLIVASIIVAATALILNARGSDDDGAVAAADVADSTAPADSSQPASTPTVDTTEIDGLGRVLTDADGNVLYASDEEAADPDVVCTDACAEFWIPVDAGSATPTGADGITGLDVAGRPGTMQVTLDGRRLYTFSLDSPGEAGGEDSPTRSADSGSPGMPSSSMSQALGHERHHDGDRRRQRRLPGY